MNPLAPGPLKLIVSPEAVTITLPPMTPDPVAVHPVKVMLPPLLKLIVFPDADTDPPNKRPIEPEETAVHPVNVILPFKPSEQSVILIVFPEAVKRQAPPPAAPDADTVLLVTEPTGPLH
jgi:hypothetical protein